MLNLATQAPQFPAGQVALTQMMLPTSRGSDAACLKNILKKGASGEHSHGDWRQATPQAPDGCANCMFHQAPPNCARLAHDACVSPAHSLQPFKAMEEKQVTWRHLIFSGLLTTLVSPVWQGMAVIVDRQTCQVSLQLPTGDGLRILPFCGTRHASSTLH